MKKKFLKGFTLVELIVVMAIMVILMAALMHMMKPIRSTFVDSTYYESERNTQSGISRYISESIRYATNLGIYTDGKSNSSAGPGDLSSVNSVTDAIKQFKIDTGVTDESKINIITIDNKTAYTYNNATYYGRLVRSKDVPASGSFTSNAAVAGTSEGRLALGDAYYGKNTYSINITPTTNGVSITISSILSDSLKEKSATDKDLSISEVSGSKLVSTQADICCYNIDSSKTSIGGKFSTNYAGTTTTSGVNTYIIFTLPE